FSTGCGQATYRCLACSVLRWRSTGRRFIDLPPMPLLAMIGSQGDLVSAPPGAILAYIRPRTPAAPRAGRSATQGPGEGTILPTPSRAGPSSAPADAAAPGVGHLQA